LNLFPVVGKDPKKINEERTIFSNELNKDDFLNGIHIDETSIIINDYKKYGYSESGKKVKMIIKHKHNKERITLLKAISKEKIIHYEILKGSVNSEIYLNFINSIIKKNSEYIKKTIFQDNFCFAKVRHKVSQC
jgi:hypothetical protein